MDTDKLLAEFEEEYAKISPAPADEIQETSSPVPPTEYSFLKRTIGIFIFIIILCAIAFFLGKTASKNTETDKNVPIQTEKATGNTLIPAPVKAETDNAPKTKPAQKENKVSKALDHASKEADKVIAKSKESNTVTVYAHKNLWVKIAVDNKPVYEGIIKGGANLEFKVRDNIKLRGGEPSSCQVNIDGKSIGKLGVPGKPFELILTPKNNSVIRQ